MNAVNGLLGKYKQGVEWFQQGQIRKIVQEGYDGAKGERALARHLQQYVFDQGVDFTVEPTSASGAVDILLRDPNGQYVIIDAKYLKPGAPSSEITRKIAGGFNQVARYCEDYDQHDGFLAVFVDDDLSLLIDSAESDSFRYFRIGGSIIYFIEVNVAKRPSASKSGKARQIHITEADLMHEIEVYN